MKVPSRLKFLSILFFILVCISCEKVESIDLTGNLIVNVGSNNTYLSKTQLPNIYIADTDISDPLIEDISVDENYTMRVDNLNYGNYYLEYFKEYTNGGYARYTKLFQINAGKTTTITINMQ